MKKLLAILLFIVLASIPYVSNKTNPEIVPVVEVDTRYNAVIRLVNEIQDNFTYCSATVISDQVAITASHCISSNSVSFADEDKLYISSALVYSNLPRLDQAVLMGDFSKFKKIRTKFLQNGLENSYGPFITCGYPFGGRFMCFSFVKDRNSFIFEKGFGRLYPAMSGGPLLDITMNQVIGINMAVNEGYVLITPIVNFFKVHRLED